MAEKCKTTGKIITNVKLWCVDASGELPWGKWDTNPKNEIGPSLEETGDIAFVALGADSSATGNEGTIKYKDANGTCFTLYFDNPYTADNSATISVDGGEYAMYDLECDYPKGGRDITVTYTINRNSESSKESTSKIDAEVLLSIPKCDSYSPERIKQFIEDRKDITLLEILEYPMDAEAKIWCMLRLPLLSPAQMRILAIKYAEHVLEYITDSVVRESCKRLLEQCEQDVMLVDKAKILPLRQEVLKSMKIVVKEHRADDKLAVRANMVAIEAVYYAANDNVITALRNSGSCARDVLGEEGWEKEATWQIETAIAIC